MVEYFNSRGHEKEGTECIERWREGTWQSRGYREGKSVEACIKVHEITEM